MAKCLQLLTCNDAMVGLVEQVGPALAAVAARLPKDANGSQLQPSCLMQQAEREEGH
jgi:hypothetical protein